MRRVGATLFFKDLTRVEQLEERERLRDRLAALGEMAAAPGAGMDFTKIRVLGGAAIVHARTTFSGADGRPASGRYTDVWCRQDGRWFVAAAHITRRVA